MRAWLIGFSSAVCLSTSLLAFADSPAPVVDLAAGQTNNTAAAPSAAPQPQLPLDQRVTILERQMNNMVQMNLPGKLNDLQQEVQQVTGQLQEQTHEIQTLNDQQRNFYQDLNQRLSDLKALVNNNTSVVSSTSAAKLAKVDSDTTSSDSGDVSDNSADEEKTYQDAFNFLANKQNAKALTGFKKYLDNYPTGKYAANSHFWLGEIYSTQNKNELASNEFNTVITKYPTNSKVPDAMLKLAIIHANDGKTEQAKNELQKINKQFPGSSAAKLANMQLQQINSQTSDKIE